MVGRITAPTILAISCLVATGHSRALATAVEALPVPTEASSNEGVTRIAQSAIKQNTINRSATSRLTVRRPSYLKRSRAIERSRILRTENPALKLKKIACLG
jgi:hypothetical protein